MNKLNQIIAYFGKSETKLYKEVIKKSKKYKSASEYLKVASLEKINRDK